MWAQIWFYSNEMLKIRFQKSEKNETVKNSLSIGLYFIQ